MPPTVGAERARLDHIAINVAEQQRSIDFYRGAFGLTEIPAPFGGAPGTPRWLRLAGGVELHVQSQPIEIAPPPRVIHIALAVQDLDATIAYLRAHGIGWSNFQEEAGKIGRDRSDGVRQIFVQDPDGYWIEVNDVAAAH